MIKKSQKVTGIILILFAIIWFIGCSDDNCEDYDVPWGYNEVGRYSEGAYESITYENGNHWIIYTTSDNGCTWDKSEYWG